MTVTMVQQAWPGLAPPPSGLRTALGAEVARRLFVAAIRRLDVTVDLRWPDHVESIGRGGPRATVAEPKEFFSRLGRDGLIGFGEAYLAGVWDSADLVGFLTVLAAQMGSLIPQRWQRFRGLAVRRIPRQHRNTRTGARSNIAHHYDLSNEMFALFLDPTMTYSSALFDGDDHKAEGLSRAQERKIDRLLDQAQVGPGTRLLEIGTGWGELAIRAARRGANVVTVTLSAEQKQLADQRITTAGLTEQISVQICDYRDVTGQFDAVVSVEMIEAVGWQFWRTYFEKIDELLVPGGRLALQAITMPHHRMLASRGTHTWITKYVFPGGALPSVRAIEEITAAHTALRPVGRFEFGQDYATTLRRWDQAFTAAESSVTQLGFDPTFCRMWHFYLNYCEAGFAAGYIDVNQLSFVKDAT
ncbi:MAG: class I SAM-dependent methyltransferase [Aeromicrobium sp.]